MPKASAQERDGTISHDNTEGGGKFISKRETFSTRIDQDLIKKLKYLAIDEQKKLNVLLEEAISMLLEEYKRKKGKLFD